MPQTDLPVMLYIIERELFIRPFFGKKGGQPLERSSTQLVIINKVAVEDEVDVKYSFN